MSVNVSPQEHNRTFMRVAPSHSFKSKLGGGPGYMSNERTCSLCVQLIESDEDAIGVGVGVWCWCGEKTRGWISFACSASACRGLECCLILRHDSTKGIKASIIQDQTCTIMNELVPRSFGNSECSYLWHSYSTEEEEEEEEEDDDDDDDDGGGGGQVCLS